MSANEELAFGLAVLAAATARAAAWRRYAPRSFWFCVAFPIRAVWVYLTWGHVAYGCNLTRKRHRLRLSLEAVPLASAASDITTFTQRRKVRRVPDAKAARDEARVMARRGEYVDRDSITVGEYLDQWLGAHAVEIKPRTLDSYRSVLRLYVKPQIGGLRLQAIRPARITKLYRDLLTSGGKDGNPLSTSTVTRLHAILRKAFSDAVLVDELLSSNPVERAKRPKGQGNELGAIWTPEQLRTFLEAVRSHRLYAFYRLAAYSRARRGELLNLRWSDVDLDGLQITIKGSTAVIACLRVEGTTKSGRSRVVRIDEGTARALREHRRRQEEDEDKAGEDWQGNESRYVFTTGRGESVHPDSVGWLMAKTIRTHNKLEEGTQPENPLSPRPPPHPCDHAAPGGRPRPRRRRAPRPRRPGDHASGLRPRDQVR